MILDPIDAPVLIELEPYEAHNENAMHVELVMAATEEVLRGGIDLEAPKYCTQIEDMRSSLLYPF